MPDEFDFLDPEYPSDEEAPRPAPPGVLLNAGEKMAADIVRELIWGRQTIAVGDVPTSLNRPLVARFIRNELRTLPAPRFWRVRTIADALHLVEIGDDLAALLDGSEATADDVERSAACVATLEESAEPALAEFGRQYYDYLIDQPLAGQRLPSLVICAGTIGPERPLPPLQDRLQAEIEQLSYRGLTDGEAAIEARYLAEIQDNEFFYIVEANVTRLRVQHLQALERWQALLAIYLQLTEDGGAEYLAEWTERQIRRAPETMDLTTIGESLRTSRRLLPLGLPEARRRFCILRSLNAMQYFGIMLEAREQEVLNVHGHSQHDPLRATPLATPPDVDSAEEEVQADEEEE